MDATGPAAPKRGGHWNWVARLFPAAAVAASYERGWLRGDLFAGLTLWALLIPQGLAYGELAGLPPVTGLYIGRVGMLAYALLGSSRYITVGPESSVAMIVAVELGLLAGGRQYALRRARWAARAYGRSFPPARLRRPAGDSHAS